MRSSTSGLTKLAAVFGLSLAVASPALAQSARVTGAVTDRASGQPLAGVQVYLEGTSFGVLTQDNGRYLLLNVPSGTYSVVAQLIGYAPARQDNVVVARDGTTTVDFQMRTSALKLEEVVVTGLADPTSGVKVPFTVGKVTAEELPVPAVNAEASIRGRVAGARVVKAGGQPGTGASVQLRGATSITKDNDPLYVVDGVILGSSTIDIESLDIESIEVVKGAAAASLYGSRAANGVVQISTKRGMDVNEGDTRIIFRSEVGVNSLPNSDVKLSRSHLWKLNSDGSYMLDGAGNRIPDDDRIVDNPFPRYFDQLDRFFDPGMYATNTVSIAQNTRSTNFYASFNDRREEGVVQGNDGFKMRSFRLNLDHRLRDDLNFAVSGAYTRSFRDQFAGNPFYDLMFMPADADLLAPNPDGDPYIIQPDPYLQQPNPLYEIYNADEYSKRGRILGSMDLRYSPVNWLSIEGNLSYDRLDYHYSQYYPKGFKELGGENEGSLRKDNSLTQTINGGMNASFLRSFGDLTTRVQAQYMLERQDYNYIRGDGDNFAIRDIPMLEAATEFDARSDLTQVRSDGYYLLTGLDYAGKYIFDFMVRRDRSSLFGPDNRDNNYYRVSGAYRMAEEDWWPIEQIGEFKVRYSRGTAGNRPDFNNQYETWSVSSGSVSKSFLGNALLKPEFVTEQEFGVDLIAFDRLSLQLTRADSKIKDALLAIPLPALYGYSRQWQNAGSIESNTWEATIQATAIDHADLGLGFGLVMDRTRGEITEFDAPCYRDGPSSAFYYCAGEPLGVMYGNHFLRNLNELPEVHSGSRNQFQVNDDGLLVAVGAGNSYTDGWGPDGQPGTADDLWGTDIVIDGVTYGWGRPIVQEDEAGNDATVRIGDSNPNLNLGLTANFRFHGLRIDALFDSQRGGDIYNNTRQWSYRERNNGDFDQAGKPTESKKPEYYYKDLYHVNSINDWFVEDGTYVKFRELSARYALDRGTLQRLLGDFGNSIARVSISLIGRNLYTWTDYSGWDPEVGSVDNSGDTRGDATRLRFDGFGYPQFRTITAAFEIEF